MRILFIGSGEFGIPTLRKLIDLGHDVCCVVTQPDRPAGRGQVARPAPIRSFALESSLPVVAPPRINDAESVHHIRSLNAELAVVVAFGQKIGRELLNAFPVGIVNLHGSLLPHLRGAAPIQWAILRGDEETGVTVFRLVERMDAGPMLSQRRTGIKEAETAEELHDRLAAIGCDAIDAALKRVAADPSDPGDPQDESRATAAPKLTKADGILDLSLPAIELERRVNGLFSWPGARCRFVSQSGRSEEVVLARALADDAPAEPTPAQDIGRISDRGGFLTGRGELAILEIQPANGRRMSWEDFVNGRHVRPGDRLVGLSHEPE